MNEKVARAKKLEPAAEGCEHEQVELIGADGWSQYLKTPFYGGPIITIKCRDCPTEFSVRPAAELARLEHEHKGMAHEANEIDQILGKALGFPNYWHKDGVIVLPDVEGAVQDDAVCTGVHTPVTLAMTVASRLAAAEALPEKWAKMEAGHVEAARKLGELVPSHANMLGWCARELRAALAGESDD